MGSVSMDWCFPGTGCCSPLRVVDDILVKTKKNHPLSYAFRHNCKLSMHPMLLLLLRGVCCLGWVQKKPLQTTPVPQWFITT